MSLTVGVNGRTFHVDEPEGAVTASIELARELAITQGNRVFSYGAQEMAVPDGTVRRPSWFPRGTPYFAYGLVWERTLLPRLARRDGVDILISPNGNGPLRDPGYPTALFIHDVSAQRGLSSGLHGLYRRGTVPRAAQVATRIVTVSEFSKQEISTHLDVPASKIDVVPVAVDELYRGDDPGDAFDLPEKYVLFAGGLNPRKNITRLVKAFRQAKRTADLPHKLVFVGPPNRAIFQSIDLASLDDVIHKGFVSKRELLYAFRNAELLAYPSLYEGFGMPPLEAMACGTAALASNRLPFTDTLRRENAELVNPESVDAIAAGIRQVLTDTDYRTRLEQNGRKRALEFTWERSGETLQNTLHSAIEEYHQ